MLSIAELHPVLHDLFHDSADTLARLSGFCQRSRKLTGSVFAQTLVFTLLQEPHATLDDFADAADELLGVSVSPQAFDQRFTLPAATFLHELFLDAFNRSFNSLTPTLLPVLRRFNGVFLRDATLVSLPAHLAALWPGRGGLHAPHGQAAGIKLVFEAEVTTGVLTEVSIHNGLQNEKVSAVAGKPLPAGSLLLEDMGFFSGERLQDYDEQGVYVLTRVPAWTAFFDEKGKRLDLLKLLRRAPGWSLERQIKILHGKQLSMRLLAVRLPDDEVQKRQERIRQEAKQRGRPVSQRKLDLCAWNILVTNAPAALLSVFDAAVVRRVRWQVELVFKVFKSEGHIDQSKSQCGPRVLCELYAKLLAMVVQNWTLLAAGYQMLRHSAQRAARRVRRRARQLLRGLRSPETMVEVVMRLAKEIHRHCRVVSRKNTPSTLDRLRDLDFEFGQLQTAA
jgi:hypothetical protein